MLAVAIGAGTAYAQAPVVPATTVAVQPSDPSKVEKPKAEEPKAEKPAAEKPTLEKPKAEKPKAEKPKAEKPKLEKAAKPGDEKPTPEKSEPAQPKQPPDRPKQAQPKQPQPKPAKPKPTPQPKPAQPKSAAAGAPGAQPNDPGPEPQLEVAKTASPRPKAAPPVAASGVRHVTTRRRPAPKESRKANHRPASAASPERSATEPAGSGRDSTDATSAISGPVAVTPILAPRLASDGAAAANASPSRQGPRVLTLDGSRPGYNATLLLVIVFTAGVAFLFGRQHRRGPGPGARR